MDIQFYEICAWCLNRYAAEYVGREEKIKPGEILCYGNKAEKTCRPSPASCMAEEQLQRMEQTILDAAAKNDDNLMDLLDKAMDKMDKARVNRLLDKVHQVQSENLRDLRGWKERG